MAEGASIPVMVRLSPEQAKALDDWRRIQDDLPGRPEAIRRLVELALKATAPVREGIKIMKPIHFKKR